MSLCLSALVAISKSMAQKNGTMTKRNHFVKINLGGGIVSAGDFTAIVFAAEQARVTEVQFGTRQQLILKLQDEYLSPLKESLKKTGLTFEIDSDQFPNIVSSYVTENVFGNSGWLSEGVYKDILDSFDYNPLLKINIVDREQTFVPFFTGNINFVSSGTGNYWYLYVRFPKTKALFRWKHLVYTQDISRISQLIEQAFFSVEDISNTQSMDVNLLYNMVQSRHQFLYSDIVEELKVPEFTLPYYEGFNRYESKAWLGIYRRDELFNVKFLKDIAAICRQTKIGQLYITPWKTLVVKGIDQSDRKLWDNTLGKYRINVRHASNELNWQVEDNCEEGLNLKRYLIRQFDKEDVRTFGLCFAIKTKPYSGLFGSIIIRKQLNDSANQRKFLDRYDLLYAEGFNPNSKDLLVFRKNVEKENLAVYLISLCKYYYSLQSNEEIIIPENFLVESELADVSDKPRSNIFQCKHCFTLYDPQYGDDINLALPGTSFQDLAATFHCPTCDAPKDDFGETEKISFIA